MASYIDTLRASAARFNSGELSYDAYMAEVAAASHNEWADSHADEIAASGKRTKLCNICRVNRVPALVHACEVCD